MVAFDRPPGWYPDPWHVKALRWFDGSQWTGIASDDHGYEPRAHVPRLLLPLPRSRRQWGAFAVAIVVGVAIWIPTMAMQPRSSDLHPTESAPSPWYIPLMFIAPVILGIVLSREWQVVAAGLLAPQFLLAPWTTPRGDNDGLWTLIVVVLAFLFVVAHLESALAGMTVNWARDRRTRRAT